MNHDTIPDTMGDGNIPDDPADEVNPVDEGNDTDTDEDNNDEDADNDEGNVPDEGNDTGEEPAAEDDDDDDDFVEDAPTTELPDVAPLVVERPRASIRAAHHPDGSYQYCVPVKYGISGNSTRQSRLHPDAKHLTIILPEPMANFFAGVWVAVKGDEVFFDFFARNRQRDRTGHSPNDPWRLIKIKDSREVAMAINRPYTKSRSEGLLVRDIEVGAFKLVVPLVADGQATERAAEDRPAPQF